MNFTPALIAILIQITIVLSAAILAVLLLTRTAVTRHAILFFALLACIVYPFLMLAAQIHGTEQIAIAPAQFVPLKIASMVDSVSIVSASSPIEPSRSFSVTTFLFGIWAGGTIVMLFRLAVGMWHIRCFSRDAAPLEPDPRLLHFFANRLPAIFTSPHVSTPMAIGFFRSVVLLPGPMVEQLDKQQLLQVLTHECAHAIRHDPLMGFYQRMLAAIFWFHPLVHWANHQLQQVREELCDNYVLGIVVPSDYAATLLTIAQSLWSVPDRLLARNLIGVQSLLESRIRRLLDKRRSTMTKLERWKFAGIFCSGLVVGMILWACSLGLWHTNNSGVSPSLPTMPVAATAPHRLSLAEMQQAAADFDKRHPLLAIPATFPQTVHFETGKTEFADGDNITITDIRGTSDTFIQDGVYQISGTYTLSSHPEASLDVYVTAKHANDGIANPQSCQGMTVQNGEGKFTLVLPMRCEGWPHISFYAGGKNIGEVYFGTGDSLLKHW